MNEILIKLAQCVEYGKIDKACPYPPNMKGHDGVDILTKKTLEIGIKPNEILENALIPAMAFVGLSDLFTTTIENMKKIVTALKEKNPVSMILIGGAPVTQEYCDKIGADFYSPDPQGAVNYLKNLAS